MNDLVKASALGRLIGLAGVDPSENDTARCWGRRLEWPMLFLALWMLISWYPSFTGAMDKDWHHITDILVWLFFVLETLLLASLVDDTRRYLRQNWMNLLIIVMGLPVLWGELAFTGILRMLRLVLLLGLLAPLCKTVRAILIRNHLGTTLLISALFIGLSGAFISAIDPAIETPWDGIWWALVTITTVGYGDLVPVTSAGKVFAGVLILVGIGLFSLLTASFSVFFLEREEEEVIDKESELLERMDHLERKMSRLENNVARLLDYQQQLLKQQMQDKRE